MAGHSKWANIKHTKARQDAKKGKVFTKLIREITIAARLGGGDAGSNPRLRAAIDKALSQNMTKDTIQRAVARGTGDGETDQLFECRYEGYGPSGVAVLVDCLTDNKNRTVSDVRHAFTKCSGNLGTDGSVSYLFTPCGLITFKPGSDEEKITNVALEADAKDVIVNPDSSIDVMTDPLQFETTRDLFLKANLTPDHAESTMLPQNEVAITDDETAEKMYKLINMLEELDDVQNVYTNADISEECLSKLND